MMNNPEYNFEILICIEDSEIKERVLSLCNSVGYKTSQQCFHFNRGESLETLIKYPLVIASNESISNILTQSQNINIENFFTQILVISHSQPHISHNSLWRCSARASDEEILFLIAKACIMYELSQNNAKYKTLVTVGDRVHKIETSSIYMKDIYLQAKKVAKLKGNILITGESGTGKSLLARYIHHMGSKSENPFIALSCAVFPRDLMEVELFGSEKGSYTGSHESRIGVVEMADNGTLFLDEIGDLPLELQPKLLTFLQDKTAKRIGGKNFYHSQSRIITATNLDLPKLVYEKKFRGDLYYRLNTFNIHLPPLRERVIDIENIANDILSRISKDRENEKMLLSPDAVNALKQHSWPGNIRELENLLEQASAFTDSNIIHFELIKKLLTESVADNLTNPEYNQNELYLFENSTLQDIESAVIKNRLRIFKNDKNLTANSLGISLKTLYNKIKK